MDRECICKIRDIYRNIAAFEAQLQRQLHLNMNDAMLLCIVAELFGKPKSYQAKDM